MIPQASSPQSMASTDLSDLFARTFADGAWLDAMGPMIALAVGALAVLLADISKPLRALRPVFLLGGMAVSAGLLVAQLSHEPGLVLDGTLLANRTTALWGLLFVGATLLAWIYSLGYYRGEEGRLTGEHDFLMMVTPIGMMLMVGAQDLLIFFVGLELLSIPLYALAAFQRARAVSVEAGIKYFLLGTFATGLLLYGTSLLYAAEGTLSIAELTKMPPTGGLALTGVALIAAAVFFKVSVFPFHLWVPDVYQGSPTPVTALMSTGTKAAAFGFLIGAAFLMPPEAAIVVAVIALVTMAIGNLGALAQEDLKRMLAYSGISHAGTLLLVVAGLLRIGTPDAAHQAMNAAFFYMGAYVFSATGAFGLLALLENDGGRFTRITSLRGLAKSRPGAAAAMALFLLSLGGIPATGGFFGKWFVFAVLVEADMIAVAVIGALLSVVALGYYLKVIVALYMQPAPEGELPPRTVRPLTAGIATIVCVTGTLVMGILPQFVTRLLP
ncbi:MAG: NADH-quinone oxidoreductase subunit NuoN [Planctomycetaceae bacterium]|nr:NADH-quinone oxidoreductase subunit NuoN [Planctomycetaceae bacterium]